MKLCTNILKYSRFRSDLVDWKKVERMRVRERIELAFHVMEREYGVTRLLDPEGEYECSFPKSRACRVPRFDRSTFAVER